MTALTGEIAPRTELDPEVESELALKTKKAGVSKTYRHMMIPGFSMQRANGGAFRFHDGFLTIHGKEEIAEFEGYVSKFLEAGFEHAVSGIVVYDQEAAAKTNKALSSVIRGAQQSTQTQTTDKIRFDEQAKLLEESSAREQALAAEKGKIQETLAAQAKEIEALKAQLASANQPAKSSQPVVGTKS